MKGFFRDVLQRPDGSWVISFITPENPVRTFYKLKDKEISIDITKVDKKRSLTANSFCWALCSDIGKAITPPISKEEVYRDAIRAVGVFIETDLVVWKIPTVQKMWSSQGIGWFMDVVDDAGIGKKMVHLYFGSSSYSVDQMRLLLDWLVDQAEQMEIPIPVSKAEEERLLAQWGKASSKSKNAVTSAAG